jgi:hypothetical protein
LFFGSYAFTVALLLGRFTFLNRQSLHANAILFEHLPRTTLYTFERLRDWIHIRTFA